MSVDGIFARSVAGSQNTRKDYLLKVDTKNDYVSITGSTASTPALRVSNLGSGLAMSVFCTVGGSESVAGHYISFYGENGTDHRAVIRCDNGKVTDASPGHGSVGTTTFPWDTVYSTNGVRTSDLKLKNIIRENRLN